VQAIFVKCRQVHLLQISTTEDSQFTLEPGRTKVGGSLGPRG